MAKNEYVCKILRFGGITLPAELRRKYDLRTGDYIKITKIELEKVTEG